MTAGTTSGTTAGAIPVQRVGDDVLGSDRRPLPPLLVLAWQEGRRIALHPVTLAGFAWGLVVSVILSDNGPRDAFDLATTAMTFFAGVPVFFAANLVASRDRRARSGELLGATPVSERTRLHALLLGTLVPATVALVVLLLGARIQSALGHFDPAPGIWHLLAGPVTVLGAALLGIQCARWFPVPGAAALVMVGMFAWNVTTSNAEERYMPLGTYHGWARWNETPDWVGYLPGSPGWHVAYLLGLCAMAATGALLPGARSPLRVLAAGAALTAVTGVFGWLQLT